MWRLYRIAWKVAACVPPGADPSKLHNQDVWNFLELESDLARCIDRLAETLVSGDPVLAPGIIAQLQGFFDQLAELGLTQIQGANIEPDAFKRDVILRKQRVDHLIELATSAAQEKKNFYFWRLKAEFESIYGSFRDAAFKASDDPPNFWAGFAKELNQRAGLVAELRELERKKPKPKSEIKG